MSTKCHRRCLKKEREMVLVNGDTRQQLTVAFHRSTRLIVRTRARSKKTPSNYRKRQDFFFKMCNSLASFRLSLLSSGSWATQGHVNPVSTWLYLVLGLIFM